MASDEHSPNPAFIQDMFNNIARRYDVINSLISFGFDRRWRKSLVKSLGRLHACRGLDVCCGTGKLTFALASAVGEKGTVVGLDFSEGMLAMAQQRGIGNQRVRFYQGDALALPFADNTFDFAVIAWGLRNVQDISQALQELTRVVKPGGQVASLDMAEPPNAVLRAIYWLLFAKAIPLLDKLFAGNREAYQHLYKSALAFPKQEALSQAFRAVGLLAVSYQNLSWGVVAIVKGIKPITSS